MKNLYISFGVVVILGSILGGTIYVSKKNKVASCPLDAMMCPDGSSVGRVGAACEFAVCKQELPSYMQKEEASSVNPESEVTPLSSSPASSKEQIPSPSKTPTTNTTPFSRFATKVASFAKESVATIQTNISSGISNVTSPSTNVVKKENAAQTPTSPIPSTINETRFDVKNNTIIDANNTVIYTIPSTPSGSTESSSSTENWETHIVNVVPVNTVAPILGAIPVTGLPGKYYLSENSFGSIENCEFSNKVYILDTTTGERTLMYEENSNTLTKDDPRACNSEIYLLATNEEKLILKYHTINTNMTCESTWSEPEKTWYLDVTNLAQKTKRYVISNTLYSQAEDEETICRTALDGTP